MRIARCGECAAIGVTTLRASRPKCFARGWRWAELGRELGIDLRSLPFSYLILDRAERPLANARSSRIIGVPRESKGYCRILSCQLEGVTEFMLQKRDDPELFRAVLRSPELPLYQWDLERDKIRGAIG